MTAPAPPVTTDAALWRQRWQRFSAAVVRAFHAYASWLVSISWRRFLLLALLLLIVVGIVHDMPPFTWTVTEQVEERVPRASAPRPAKPAEPPAPPAKPGGVDVPIRIEPPKKGDGSEGLDISIGKDGIRITPRRAASAPGGAASAPAAPGSGASAAPADDVGVRITLPPGVTSEAVRDAVEVARREVEEALREAREEAEQARREAEAARDEAERALSGLAGTETRKRRRVTRFGIGDFLMQFTVLWLLGSALIKGTYKGRMQAERQAARATETAESESLKRQVVEARMAAMQAQVEPHFLFNTLASIDHLIETDAARASQMQRNLIALLRASMPTMRETAGGGTGTSNGLRDLGRELAVIRPYLEILKVRMEERLATEIDVPEGLHSAEFPPMMIQTLVENAIKHGLEPKAEGGRLSVKAQIVHGKLQVVVADTGLGFGKAATAGTGVGLANIRERLQLHYGPKASLTVAENSPSGTVVTITVPYKMVGEAQA
ncbi:MAG: histidine kinase [Rubrivivax sp.]|nr:histidine kinase [Rubrivivax sp.]